MLNLSAWYFDVGDPSKRPLFSVPGTRLAVLDEEGTHPLVFPCEKTLEGWKRALTGPLVDLPYPLASLG